RVSGEQAASLEHRLQRLRERRSALQNLHGTAVDDLLDGQSPHQHEFGAEILQEVCSLRQIHFVLVPALQLLLLDDPTEGDLILAVEIEADDRVHSVEVAAFDHIEVCTVPAFQDVGDADILLNGEVNRPELRGLASVANEIVVRILCRGPAQISEGAIYAFPRPYVWPFRARILVEVQD